MPRPRTLQENLWQERERGGRKAEALRGEQRESINRASEYCELPAALEAPGGHAMELS